MTSIRTWVALLALAASVTPATAQIQDDRVASEAASDISPSSFFVRSVRVTTGVLPSGNYADIGFFTRDPARATVEISTTRLNDFLPTIPAGQLPAPAFRAGAITMAKNDSLGEKRTQHWFRLDGLEPNRTYFYVITTTGPDGRTFRYGGSFQIPDSRLEALFNEPIKAQGRVKGSPEVVANRRPLSICDAARQARARNSPAAPGLEAQCRVQGEQPPIDFDGLAIKGEAIAGQDPLSAELRNQQAEGPVRLGFDIGMGAAEGQTAPGPGKQAIQNRLSPAEQGGFISALAFSLDRNRNADLARIGAAVAMADSDVATARAAQPDALHRLGFDIATGIFGDPALGAQGNTATGPGSLKIRDSLSAAAQRGFNAAFAFHTSEVVAPAGRSGARPRRKDGTAATATQGTHASILTPDLWKAPFIGKVQVTPGWKLVISFASTQRTNPVVEIGPVAPVRGSNGFLTFPAGSVVASQSLSSNTGRYHSEFDVLREGFEAGRSYHYIINVLNDEPNSLRERDQETGRFTMASAGNPSYVCVYREAEEQVLGVDGSLSSCSPYTCQAGRCRTSCNVVSDCLPPYLCDSNSKCILPPRD